MADSAIEWTDKTWNPVTGCRKVSPGCKHCYAEGVAERFWESQYPPVPAGRRDPDDLAAGYETRPRRFTDVQVHPDRLDQPLRWRKPARIFVNSMSDLFHEDVPDKFIADVFGVMAHARQHTYQILTKRPGRMRDVLSRLVRGEGVDAMRLEAPLPNVWLGVSVEDQQRADERIPLLLDTPAAVRFLSCEPLLGPVDLSAWLPYPVFCHGQGFESAEQQAAIGQVVHAAVQRAGWETLHWMIVGGESGPGARPMDLAWARSLVEQGRAAGVPVFVKQLGPHPFVEYRDHFSTRGLRDRKGGDPDEWPADLRVREFPGDAA